MHRTIGDSYGTSGGKNIFRQENLPSYDATQVTFDTMNAVQEELANIVEGFGVTLNTPSEAISAMNQAYTVIKAAIDSEASARNANDRVQKGDLVRDQVNSVNTAFREGNVTADLILLQSLLQLGRDMQGYWIGAAGWPSSSVNINPGIARATGADVVIRHNASALRKQLDAVWAVGDLVGGRASTIALTDDTWYHLFLIKKADGTVDAGYDTNLNASALLADSGYTYYRRVASVYWIDTTSKIRPFVHNLDDDYFLWNEYVSEGSFSVPPAPTVTTRQLASSMPLGLSLRGDFWVSGLHGASISQVQFWDGTLGGASIPTFSFKLLSPLGEQIAAQIPLITDNSQNVYLAETFAGSASTATIYTRGYHDRRAI